MQCTFLLLPYGKRSGLDFGPGIALLFAAIDIAVLIRSSGIRDHHHVFAIAMLILQ